MRKLSAAVDRFAYNHPRFGIPNLMLYIVGANALIYLLTVFAGIGPVSFLAFDWASIKAGELWRLVTFLFMPGYFSSRDLIWLVLFLYLYYMIGSTLEREWGTAKFSLYYLSGAVLTILTGVLMGLITGNAVMMGADYVNLSLFFAFAALYPETRFVLFFIIPIKVKWLAIADGVLFAVSALGNLLRGDILGVVTPVIALLNFFVFFWGRSGRRDRLPPGPGPAPDQPPDHPVQVRRPPAAQKGGGAGLPPQVRRLRPHRHGPPRAGVPVLLPLRRLPLLLPGPHLQPRPLHRMITQEGLR